MMAVPAVVDEPVHVKLDPTPVEKTDDGFVLYRPTVYVGISAAPARRHNHLHCLIILSGLVPPHAGDLWKDPSGCFQNDYKASAAKIYEILGKIWANCGGMAAVHGYLSC